MINQLYDVDLLRKAPSIFALEAWQERSEHYKFIPTINVINGLRDNGYYPVKASQSRSRIEGKENFTKHMLRFRANTSTELAVNDVIPEIVLINSHDGTSAYKMMLGLFRLVCSNGLVVADAMLASIRVRHSGSDDLVDEVIETSRRIISEAPKTLETVKRWEGIPLVQDEQLAFANSVKALNYSTVDVPAERLLQARRSADMGNGSRSLWKTYNVVQENIIKGRVVGRGTNGRLRHTREIKAVDKDVKINTALWTLAEEMAKLKSK